jgi:hypothetical protein
MLYFFANYQQSQIINRSGSPFSGDVIKQLKDLEVYDTLRDIATIDHLSVSELPKTGPGGNPGVMLSVAAQGERPTAARFDPERQAWMQVSSAVWIGTEVDPVSGAEIVPRPAQLERPKCPVTSYENVQLADGSVWEVPVIREPISGGQLLPNELHHTGLPQSFSRGVDSHWRMSVLPAYQDLWKQSQEMFEAIIEGRSISYVDLMVFAVDVLALRYRFNLLVHSRWPDRWLTTANVLEVCRAAIGWRIVIAYVEDQKKSRADLT